MNDKPVRISYKFKIAPFESAILVYYIKKNIIAEYIKKWR